jgi:hypothetical protein
LQRWFVGVREHLIFTPGGRIAFVLQLPGNRHDVQGLYALLKTSFRGQLVGDNAYWPKAARRPALADHGITVIAPVARSWHLKNSPKEQALLGQRWPVERRIGLFDRQFHAGRTLCRSPRHYEARRWTKVLAHNLSRHVNQERHWRLESLDKLRPVA